MNELKNTVLFRRLSKEHWLKIEPLLELKVMGTNTIISTAGSPGDSLYFIAKGSVLLLYPHDENKYPLLILHEGEYFGEFSVLQPGTRLLSAKAADNCTLAKISHDALEQLRKDAPDAHWALTNTLIRLIHLKARYLIPDQLEALGQLVLSGRIGPGSQNQSAT